MGRIIVEQIVSADGYTADRTGGIDFFEAAGDFSETQDEQMEMMAGVDAIVFGANTYRMFADYWPKADSAIEHVAVPINSLPKHVFSSTLDEAPWGDLPPAIIERGDGVDGVKRLRDEYDGDLIIWGSLTLVDSLLQAGVVDVLRLRIVPVLIGQGRAIAPPTVEHRVLTLTGSQAFPRGHLSLTYELND
ncbi:MAG: bifunctional deaminase-reductase domain protein [Rhodoglobus sp.]|nr:bifunctional deaminase-reductase domain protein [Rhodoglobus sp.]